jgi:hemolysin activation/secretion protein
MHYCVLAAFCLLAAAPGVGVCEAPAEQSALVESVALRGIAVVSDLSSLDPDALEGIRGVYVGGGVALPTSVKELQRVLEPLVRDQTISRDSLLAIREELLHYYHVHEQHMVYVEIPEQDVTSGVVAVVVDQARVGEVSYRGNRWFSKQRVEKALSLHAGDVLDKDALLNNIAWLNQNPFHYTEAVLSPGKQQGLTDLDIVTTDRSPLRAYAGGDNSGVESTGKDRWYLGITWGDAFFVDDLLTYQFTTNSTYDRYHSHFAGYVSYLPWKHILDIYGGYAKIEPHVSDFHSHGKEAQASLRYKVPFKPLYTNFQHQLYFGFDYKYETSALFFVGEVDASETVMNSQVNVSQLVLGYLVEYTPSHHQWTIQFEFYASPAKWLPHQTQHAYSSLRAHATPRYFYGTISLGDIYTFSSKESLAFLLRAQGSANSLVPSEQFALGGYNTVRGYEENVFISDNGVCINGELRSRPWSFFTRAKDALTLLAFIDYGWGYNYHAFDGIKKAAILWGAGPGLRYRIPPYLDIRVDYGFKLHHVKFDDNNLGMWHVGATLSY